MIVNKLLKMASENYFSFTCTILVATIVASSGILAELCDFNLSQSADKLHTRIQVGQQEAIINYVYHSRWLGIVKNATGATVSDADGKSNSRHFSSMDEEQLDAYQNLLEGVELDGTSISLTEGGQVSVSAAGDDTNYLLETVAADGSLSSSGSGYSTFSDLAEADANEMNKLSHGVLDIETPGRSRFLSSHLFAVLNANDFWGFNHIVFLLPSDASSPVVIVDNQCSRIKILTNELVKTHLKGY